MTEFEEWWKANWDYDTKDKPLGPKGAITDTQVKGGEKKAAEQAWNEALSCAQEVSKNNTDKWEAINPYILDSKLQKLKTTND